MDEQRLHSRPASPQTSTGRICSYIHVAKCDKLKMKLLTANVLESLSNTIRIYAAENKESLYSGVKYSYLRSLVPGEYVIYREPLPRPRDQQLKSLTQVRVDNR